MIKLKNKIKQLGGEGMSFSKLLKSNLTRAITLILATVLGAVLVAVGNSYLTNIGNSLQQQDINAFLRYMLLFFVVLTGGESIEFIANYLFAKQVQEYLHEVRERVTRKLFLQKETTKITDVQNSLTNDLNMMNDNFLTPLYKIISSIFNIVFSIAIVFTYSWILVVLILILAVVMFVLPQLISKPLEKATVAVSENNQAYLDTIEKWFKGIAILKRYNVKSKLFQVLAKSSDKLEKANVNRSKKVSQTSIFNNLVNGSAQVLIIFTAGLLIITKSMPFGAFFSIGNFSGVIFTGLFTVVSQITLIQSSKQLNKKITANMATVDTEVASDSLADFATVSGQNLTIKFPNGEQLRFPDFEVKQGEKILLTGDSGAGKSTLFKLILDELTPSSGKIVFKDKNGKLLKPNLNQIGYIPQDPVLFPGTIQENITLFNDSLNEKAKYWAEKVQLGTDLTKFPQGIKTKVDLDKNNLSGGQRQKVVLARTQVYESKLVLIDEGTSAIDSKNTQIILQNLLQSSATVIFIAHNLTPEMHKLFDRELKLTKA